jgi:hypothetical protein
MYRLACAGLLLLACTACEKEPDEDPFFPPAGAHRTVLVYLGTDNNFRAEAAEKIATLRDNWNDGNDGNLLIYADNGNNPVLLHIYRHPHKGNIADTLAVYPSENSASPQTLARVLEDVRVYRPAASYGLVVLSHGTGWLLAGMSQPKPMLKSVILDKGTEESDNYMELVDFAAAIPCALDFIVFDACFMGSVEVCYELKNKADYIVASPAEVLVPGFVYSSMMQRLFQPEADLTGVARDFYEYYAGLTGLNRSATVSVVKTAELENLRTVFQEITGFDSPPSEGLGEVQTFGYGGQKIYFDLGDCVQKLSPARYEALQAALADCIVYKACTDSYYSAGTGAMQKIRAFSGLSVYVPQAAYLQANEAYRHTRWALRVNLKQERW